jgi:hypothetical protein
MEKASNKRSQNSFDNKKIVVLVPTRKKAHYLLFTHVEELFLAKRKPTLSVGEELLREAKVLQADEGGSLSGVVEEPLEYIVSSGVDREPI